MSKRILLVDDDPMIRRLVRAILIGSGFEVVLATNGRECMEILDNEPRPIDLSLVILDVIMPELNGLDVLTRMRLNQDTQDIPVVMLTGEDKAEYVKEAYSIGANHYIPKPFNREELIKGIDFVLEGEGDQELQFA